MKNEAIVWCIDNCAAYVYGDEAKDELRAISAELERYETARQEDADHIEALIKERAALRVQVAEAGRALTLAHGQLNQFKAYRDFLAPEVDDEGFARAQLAILWETKDAEALAAAAAYLAKYPQE